MGLIFDTSVWIGLAKRQMDRDAVMKIAADASIYASAISLGELAYGVESCADPAERAERFATYRQIDKVPVLTVSRDTASAFGLLAASVKQLGRSPRARYNDLWIAAQAIETGFPLVTANPNDFQGLPGLQLVAI